MTRKAIFFLCTLCLCFLCLGEYFSIETIGIIYQQMIKGLPFGDWLCEMFLALTDYPESTVAIIAENFTKPVYNFLQFTKELTQLVVTSLLYSILVKNAIEILIKETSPGANSFFDTINSKFFKYFGFVISSIGAAVLIKCADELFLNLETPGAAIIQCIVYWIVTLGIGAFVIFFFLEKKELIQNAVLTAVNSIAMLLVIVDFLIMIDNFRVTHALSMYLVIIFIFGLAVNFILDKKLK